MARVPPPFFLGPFLGKRGSRSSGPTLSRARSSLLTVGSSAPGPRVGRRRTGTGSTEKTVAVCARPLRFNWRPWSVACSPREGPGQLRPAPGAGAVAPPGLPHTPVRGAAGPSHSHPAHPREPRRGQGVRFWDQASPRPG